MSTPYMFLDLPVPTVTLGPAWAQQLNTAIEFIDAHDHTTGKGQLITSAAINIDDDLSFNNNRIESAKILGMQNQASAQADTRALYSVNGELYYTDGVGNQIAITAGGALNASSVGGIGGDYGSSTANVYYNSISKTFIFDQDVDQRAKLDIGDLLIRETVVGANAITIKSPTSLASAYELTLPTGLPASTLPVVVSNTGVLSHQQLNSSQLAADSVITSTIADDQITLAKFAPNTVGYNLKRELFTSSGTWVCPTGVNSAIFRVMGAGGGGGGGGGLASVGANPGGGGGGGGGSGVIVVAPNIVVPAASYTITVGAGGSGGAGGTQLVNGTNGGTGGTSSVQGSQVSIVAPGGTGGTGGNHGNASGTGGTGGGSFTSLYLASAKGGNGGAGTAPTGAGVAGSTGESHHVGGNAGAGGAGTQGDSVGAGGGGGGGAAGYGSGGAGSIGRIAFAAMVPATAGSYAAGGGGGAGGNNNDVPINQATAGAAGGPGLVEVYYLELNP